MKYLTEGFYDEIFEDDHKTRFFASQLIEKCSSLEKEDLMRRQKAADLAFRNIGITFNVYSDGAGVEKVFPFDMIPRIVESYDWQKLEEGLKQRTEALNLFIDDMYHRQLILKDKVIPEEIIYSSKGYLKQCIGLNPPRGIWNHISGIDIIRDSDGRFYVLEDNLRCPSGVSYVLENRLIMKRIFPTLFNSYDVQPIDDYPHRLLEALRYLSKQHDPVVVVLTPGIYNSAYFEHTFLAQQMGVELVEGRDLVIVDGYVNMRTTRGFERVDVIYRRIDDDFIDPKVFRHDSFLGIPGIIESYRKGNVALANAPGTGVADDKTTYAYVDKIIRYYLDEGVKLNNVPTYICYDEKDRTYVLENIETLVVKSVSESGGYGMLIGPASTKEEREHFKELIKANPRTYIAQPTIALSRVPTIVDNNEIEGRHVDLRPFIIYGEDIYVMPGGLTRVALKKGSLVVNSSQGGGSKDTWVLYEKKSPAQEQIQTQTQR
jgi:uncharacterized circularly permuted ATP-grasp superfamily protein